MRRKRIFSVTLALCLCVSAAPTAQAWQGSAFSEQELSAQEISDDGTATLADVESLTYEGVYNSMAALESIYPEGTPWTNFTPYSSNNVYRWHGGEVKGVTGGVGCAAFAFLLSDAAFGNLPARALNRGQFTFADVRAGDILRVDNDSHFVIVLQKSDGGVILAEGNYNSSVHWRRTLSEEKVMEAAFMITRYSTDFVSADDANANDEVDSGSVENSNINWSLTKAGRLTISGSGAIPDFSPNDNKLPPWNEKSISTIVIEKGVTGIGDYAFNKSKALSVNIPSGVTGIGESAFCEAGIMSVAIPGTVTTIGNNAFRECPYLTSVTVSEGVKTIGDNAFRGCVSLTYIDFPASIISVGEGAFMSCKEMTRVRFKPGSGKVTMGDNLFSQCWELTDVTLPRTADRISAGMFASCSKLPTLYIPATVTTIGENPFTSCRSLKTINFGGTREEWNAMAPKSLKDFLQSMETEVVCEVEFKDPFAGETDHEHSWAADWKHNDTYHWHECVSADCSVTDDSKKDSYGKHDFGSGETGTVRTCTVCGYSKKDSGVTPALNPGTTTVIPTSEPATPEPPTPEPATPVSPTPVPATPVPTTPVPATPEPATPEPIPTPEPVILPTAPAEPAAVTETTTKPDGTQVTVETTTDPDGSETKKTTEVKADGSRTETTTVTNADGSRTETVTVTNTDGSRQERSNETAADGTVTKETVTDVAADGSATKTEDTKATNTKGTEVAVSTVTKTDSTGKVTDVTEKYTFAPDSGLTATVTVKKDGDDNVTKAAADLTNNLSAGSKATLRGSVVSQLTEAAGQKDLVISMTVKDADGKTAYKVKANAADLTVGKELYIYAYNQKTDTYTMVNAKTYKVNNAGSISISMKDNRTYELVDSAAAKKINKQILDTVKVKKSSATVKRGKKTTIALKAMLNKNNVKKITYSTSSKSVATVSRTGKVTAKKGGVATIRAKVTLKNGSTKTVRMKVNVKSGRK